MEEYNALGHIDWVLRRPGVYIGSTLTTTESGHFFENRGGADGLCVEHYEEMPSNEGLLKIIFEVIDNALDNADTTKLTVEVNDLTVKVTNNGRHIPCVQRDLGNGVTTYVPTTLFGVLMSGSKFSESRGSTIGMNGLGVKVTNIMSTTFTVRCTDPSENVHFEQAWANNMRETEGPVISRLTKKALREYSTQVEFAPDMAQFRADTDKRPISLSDMRAHVFTRLVEVSALRSDLRVTFNGEAVRVSCFRDYVKLFAKGGDFVHAKLNGMMELGVIAAPSFRHHSFVNGHRTVSKASTHTQFVINGVRGVAAARLVAMRLNSNGDAHANSKTVTDGLHVFVTVTLPDPKLVPQSKTTLVTPMPETLRFPQGPVVRFLKSSGALDRAVDLIKHKQVAALNRATNVSKSKQRQILGIPKLDDAHDAGKAGGKDAMLFLVEGDSAKTMVVEGMSVIGRKKYGVYPLKGKLLNTTDRSRKAMVASKEIANIIEILGLRFDRTYETEAELRTLRYGSVCCMTDADVDGHHITGLIIAFFQSAWPSLLKHEYLKRFVTPVIRVELKKRRRPGEERTKYFFTTAEYETFVATGAEIANVRHLKGLGTSKREECVEYFSNMRTCHLKDFVADRETGDLVRFVFGQDGAGWRRKWISEACDVAGLDYSLPSMNMSEFIRSEMLAYSLYNVTRSIPSAVDGLKVSQRKIVFACMAKFGSPDASSFKVAQLGALVAAMTNYAHGEVSLTDAIVNMAQSFPGSNNLPLLMADGSFGTRRENGSDAAHARYIFTNILPATRVLFGDTDALEYLVVENAQVEPRLYYPALPMVLLNGSNGIATGFRSFVPCFAVSKVIQNIIRLCELAEGFVPGHDEAPLVPYYNGGYKTNDLTRLSEDGSRWVFEGLVERVKERDFVITEIPIGYSVEGYYAKVLAPLLKSRDVLEVRKDHPTANSVRFVGRLGDGQVNCEDLVGLFKLRATENTRTMNLLGVDGRVINFDTPSEILTYWFNQRSSYMDRLKETRLRAMREDVRELDEKLCFMRLVIEESIDVMHSSKENITMDMAANGLPETSHDKLLAIPIVSFSKDRYDALTKQRTKKVDAIEKFEKTSIYDMMRCSLSKLLSLWKLHKS